MSKNISKKKKKKKKKKVSPKVMHNFIKLWAGFETGNLYNL
jgi:hypothetical protein